MIYQLRDQLKQDLANLALTNEPVIGWWQPEGKYFIGIEYHPDVSLSANWVSRDLPESKFAVFEEKQRGQVGGPEGYAYQVWLPASGYKLNEIWPGDLEVYKDINHTDFDDECQIWIPIR